MLPALYSKAKEKSDKGSCPILIFGTKRLKNTLAFSIQVLCYGLFMTSTVSFADQIVRPCDLVKAQSCFTLVTVVSSILSSFVGGALFQALGATPTLGVAAVTAAVGLAISLISIVRIKLVREEAAR